jgi:trigger factor
VKLGKYKGFEIGKGEVKVTEEDVNNALEAARKDNASLVVKEGESALGDTVVMDFLGTVDGVPFEGGAAENYELELGSHQFIPGFEEQLVGHKAGEKVDVNVTFPENYTEELKGKAAVFACTIHEVKEKKLPELNDEFVKELKVEGVETVDAFRAHKETELKRQKENEARRNYMSKLIEAIAKEAQVELAQEIVDSQTETRKEDMVKRIQQSGLQLEQYLQILGQSEEQFTAQIREQALKETTEYVVLEEIGKAENLEVSDADLEFEFAKIAEQYHMTVEEVKKALNKNLEEFRHNIKMQRIDDFLYNQNN